MPKVFEITGAGYFLHGQERVGALQIRTEDG
jgi:hypothetical protein